MQIKMNDLGMTYSNGKRALDGINTCLESPNLIGLLGPNGAGKSTLIKLLSASLLPSQGSIELDGKPLRQREAELKKNLGYLPQTFGLYDELTIWQFLDYMAALKGISDAKPAIEKALAAANLSALSKKRIRTLSGGQKQRVGIAQAMLGEPKFLIFDEPTVGLDPEERIHFRNLFSGLSRDRLVLLSTHIIDDVQSICNRIIVINGGRILFEGFPAELIKSAEGHVGIFYDEGQSLDGLQITSRVNTADGVLCRVVANELPSFAENSQPTLEDAYMFRIMREGRR